MSVYSIPGHIQAFIAIAEKAKETHQGDSGITKILQDSITELQAQKRIYESQGYISTSMRYLTLGYAGLKFQPQRVEQIFHQIFPFLTPELQEEAILEKLKEYPGEKKVVDTEAFLTEMWGKEVYQADILELTDQEVPFKRISVPHQFKVDLARCKVRASKNWGKDEVIFYPGHDGFAVYQAIAKQIGYSELEALSHAAHQGVGADLLMQIHEMIRKKLTEEEVGESLHVVDPKDVSGKDDSLSMTFFKDKEKRIHFIFKKCFGIRKDEKLIALLFACQEIVAPAQELVSFAVTRSIHKRAPQEVEKLAAIVPNLKIYNTFSRVVDLKEGLDAGYAEALRDVTERMTVNV